MLTPYCTYSRGHALAFRRRATTGARVQSQASPCEMYGGANDTGRGLSPSTSGLSPNTSGLSPSTSGFPCLYFSTNGPCSFVYQQR